MRTFDAALEPTSPAVVIPEPGQGAAGHDVAALDNRVGAAWVDPGAEGATLRFVDGLVCPPPEE
jgi:hypothetical protein